MPLSKHVNADTFITQFLKKNQQYRTSKEEEFYFEYDSNVLVPRYEIPERPANSKLVYRTIEEELTLDGTPTLNLASFVNTSSSETMEKLLLDNFTKNLSDNDEYPALIEIQDRCVAMLGNLWHAPSKRNENGDLINTAIGTATTGSSEAIMLAGLAMKRTWQAKRKAEGKDYFRPNILMASCAQVALEKFANYFDVENRLIPISSNTNHVIDTTKIKENIDENTIGVFVIMGSTFTGAFEPVKYINDLLDEVQKEKGYDIPIHVDGASGGFVAPFCFPSIEWDFRVPRVVSINTSGHKYGLTTVGLGWVIWRSRERLPESLRFSLDYLGGTEESFGLNFSRPGFQVIMQYYNFLHLGFEGYQVVFDGCLSNARLLSDCLEASGYYKCLSVINKKITDQSKKIYYTDKKTHNPNNVNEHFKPGLPVVAFTFSDEFQEEYPEIPQELVSTMLRNKGIIVPNYHLPPDEGDTKVLRVVVRISMSMSLLEKLIEDIIEITKTLMQACKEVRKIANKEEGAKDSHEISALIRDMLMSITTGGLDNLKLEQEKTTKRLAGKDGRTFRGPC
ncbi:hypothetical protein DIURU_000267 [Diutina rugosa]|uniref:Glutamate decarboxylase n=1 Tax=Diutina rugosa TaxID=5481 RepID=A0A642UZ23_DIURU|nr:uncharacterized protein DIURU_000267 [Diutina rugosa]KAA8908170.1 hypothetical protein DIURU_000267 [Diutina rugosa]